MSKFLCSLRPEIVRGINYSKLRVFLSDERFWLPNMSEMEVVKSVLISMGCVNEMIKRFSM